jgi:hypothetical protein
VEQQGMAPFTPTFDTNTNFLDTLIDTASPASQHKPTYKRKNMA